MSARVIEACEALLRLDAEHDSFVGSLPGDFGPTLAREYLKLAAVVAAQREALLGVTSRATPGPGSSYLVPDKAIKRARAALDAEGVSEPGRPTCGQRARDVGDGDASLPAEHCEPSAPGPTSPVDTARPWTCSLCGRQVTAYETCEHAGCSWSGPTSPVDTAPRGYVEHGPDGPQAVYHAETPDAYLAKGDRP